MNGFWKNVLKIIKIVCIFFVIGLILYFSLIRYIDRRMEKNAEQEKDIEVIETKNKAANDKKAEEGKLLQAEADKKEEYAKCLSKAYRDYQTKYKDECSNIVIDGQCQISGEKLYEIQNYYLYDKKQCEKLK